MSRGNWAKRPTPSCTWRRAGPRGPSWDLLLPGSRRRPRVRQRHPRRHRVRPLRAEPQYPPLDPDGRPAPEHRLHGPNHRRGRTTRAAVVGARVTTGTRVGALFVREVGIVNDGDPGIFSGAGELAFDFALYTGDGGRAAHRGFQRDLNSGELVAQPFGRGRSAFELGPLTDVVTVYVMGVEKDTGSFWPADLEFSPRSLPRSTTASESPDGVGVDALQTFDLPVRDGGHHLEFHLRSALGCVDEGRGTFACARVASDGLATVTEVGAGRELALGTSDLPGPRLHAVAVVRPRGHTRRAARGHGRACGDRARAGGRCLGPRLDHRRPSRRPGPVPG